MNSNTETKSGESLEGQRYPLHALLDDAHRILSQLTPVEREVTKEEGRYYLSRVLPCLSADDLIERLRAAAALRDSEEKYRALLNEIDEGFCIVQVLFDENGKPNDFRFLETNPAFERHTGLKEATGKTIREFALDIEDFWFNVFGKVALTGVPAHVEEHAAALGRWFEGNGVRIGKPEDRQVAALFRDITERKAAEKDLENARGELETRVTERTAELNHNAARLRSLARELVSAEHRERKRLASLLHDGLQQFLVAAKMRLDRVRRQSDSEGDRNIDAVADMLEQSLHASRDLTWQLRPPVLYEDGLVPALRWLASDMEKRHGLTVSVEAGEGAIPLKDDVRALLFEAVRELLFNVVKHAEANEATIRVERQPGQLIIAVEDTGKGMDSDKLEKHSQDGIGLFSVHERMLDLGGNLMVESVPGAGTRVMLTVSLQEERKKSPEKESLEREEPGGGTDVTAGSQSYAPTRLLIVDDHQLVRQGVGSLLGEDYRLVVVGEAGNGQEAIEAIEFQRPDVVLMDVNIPVMNGIDATREIRRRWPNVRIVAMSVHDDEATTTSMMEAGAVAFIRKSDPVGRMIAAILKENS